MPDILDLPSGLSIDGLTTALNERFRELNLTVSGIQATATPSTAAGSTGNSSLVIPPRSITAGHFASTLKAILLVPTLPALPNSGYPLGTVVLNEADGVLYSNNGGTWQTFINITPGSITTTDIAPGSITTPLLAANSVTALNMAANSVVAGTVAAGAIRASDAAFAAAAIQTADIADLAVTSAKIASLDVVKLTASGSITTAILTVQNVGSSGIVTDITQGVDPSTGLNFGIQIKTNGGNGRMTIAPTRLDFFNSSNNDVAQLGLVSNCAFLTLLNTSGSGIRLDGQQGAVTIGGSTGTTASFGLDGSGNGLVQVSDTTGSGFGTPALRASLGVDGSDRGYCSMYFGGSARYAPGVNANGKRMVWGIGTFSSGAVNIATGLTTVEHFSATVANASVAEALYITGGSGGTVNTASTLGSGSSSFDWFAIGT